MQLVVAAVGTRMPTWVSQGWLEYSGRFPGNMPLKLCEIPARKRNASANLKSVAREEGEALLKAVPDRSTLIALDERGKQWSTMELARQFENWMQVGTDVGFLIGGPEGLDDRCLDQARSRWSLGKLTLPHPLVRVIVAESLYRAWSVTRNHPYHRQ